MISHRPFVTRGAAVAAALLTTACAVVPSGPSVPAMPGSSKAWNQFQVDDAQCRQAALGRSGATSDAAASAGAGSAVAGTLIGAAVGGLVGGGEGAAVGAGMGLFTGSVVGANNAYAYASTTQQVYDNTYFQCMYALGNKVPVPARYASAMRPAAPAGSAPRVAAPPPNAAIPPRNAPPPNAAIPPPDTPAPYQLPR